MKILLVPLAILAFIVFLIVLGAIGLGIAFLILATLGKIWGADPGRTAARTARSADARRLRRALGTAGRAGAQQAWTRAALLTTSKARPGIRFSWSRSSSSQRRSLVPEMYQLEPLSATIRPYCFSATRDRPRGAVEAAEAVARLQPQPQAHRRRGAPAVSPAQWEAGWTQASRVLSKVTRIAWSMWPAATSS